MKWVIFHIQHNKLHQVVQEELNAKKNVIENTNLEYARLSRQREREEIEQLWNEVKLFMQEQGIRLEGFTLDYFEELYQEAGSSVSVIKDEILYSLSVKQIRNYLGWLKCAVKDRYSKTASEVVEGVVQEPEKVAALEERPVYTEDKLYGVWVKYREKDWMPEFLAECGCVSLEEFESIIPTNDMRLKASIDFRRGAAVEKPNLQAVQSLVWEKAKEESYFDDFVFTFEFADVEIIEGLLSLQERLSRLLDYKRERVLS